MALPHEETATTRFAEMAQTLGYDDAPLAQDDREMPSDEAREDKQVVLDRSR